ncbi:glycoside hydrolase family 30 beta sandwich domain-containing protein [Cytophagaceae bacterium DM2B3-1]|uniref:Glycoside hydrolase family 30 beta sandwich domain-containing protein n=1 Tax=Xanthocytophaga flava TaxID=3048013 RepID=A0ABT7CMP1_9BACT|nr:glycoside hydrolase family 30 beta sandwich domain-containing protein [Xanthocytophaga flavus]MDJ1494950.1 glycoside hydrolase family 30 beta sandwich domain-containing protein [Xanthocytophaga flavus]
MHRTHSLFRVSGIVSLFALMACIACKNNTQDQTITETSGKTDVEVWLTTTDKSTLFSKQPVSYTFGTEATTLPTIEIDTTQTFQTMDGFGYTLTGGSAYVLHQKLKPEQRATLLKELFDTNDKNIGISYLRVSIGSSDLDSSTFSYNDLPAGQTDEDMQKFNLAPDKKDLVPVLKEILAINPSIKILGSPWSPPAWMKSNNSTIGGKLKPEYYAAYAKYFVKYVQEMAKEGITIDAITVQNEPENPKNNPSLDMTAPEQATFVKKHLGPAFEAAGIKTKIQIFDHNCDHPNYPISILNDSEAKKYIDGSAFHLYLGSISALTEVHNAHPDKHVYFTEQWTSSEGQFGGDLQWAVKNLIIGATRNWSRNVLQWNLAADPQQNPHTPGGCTQCLGALTIGDTVRRNVSYYTIAHASKFVRPGSVRIASTELADLPNVAFKTPSGKKVLIVLNEGNTKKDFAIKINGKSAPVSINAASVATFVF